jgi:hypothetical protein
VRGSRRLRQRQSSPVIGAWSQCSTVRGSRKLWQRAPGVKGRWGRISLCLAYFPVLCDVVPAGFAGVRGGSWAAAGVSWRLPGGAAVAPRRGGCAPARRLRWRPGAVGVAGRRDGGGARDGGRAPWRLRWRLGSAAVAGRRDGGGARDGGRAPWRLRWRPGAVARLGCGGARGPPPQHRFPCTRAPLGRRLHGNRYYATVRVHSTAPPRASVQKPWCARQPSRRDATVAAPGNRHGARPPLRREDAATSRSNRHVAQQPPRRATTVAAPGNRHGTQLTRIGAPSHPRESGGRICGSSASGRAGTSSGGRSAPAGGTDACDHLTHKTSTAPPPAPELKERACHNAPAGEKSGPALRAGSYNDAAVGATPARERPVRAAAEASAPGDRWRPRRPLRPLRPVRPGGRCVRGAGRPLRPQGRGARCVR